MSAPMSLLAVETFLEAFRDAGYRGLPGALSELVDNALEAGATRVDIQFQVKDGKVDQVLTLDNGCGIPKAELPRALQLGGSTRFDSREGFGRYGVGLPGSSISQARRLDVFSWTNQERPWWSFLSLDEVKAGRGATIPSPSRATPPLPIPAWAAAHGTMVVWSSCDRLKPLDRAAKASLRRTLGQTFRESIWAGCELQMDGEAILPVDPLYLRTGVAPAEAVPYGPPLVFAMDLLEGEHRRRAHVIARFSELPLENWSGFSNQEKRRLGISKGGGISVLRNGREIDFGWFFMGDKRKEAYDDWWRCELTYSPELDSFFGITHTKQGIHPSADLEAILAPDLERVAHELNGRVRRRFQELRAGSTPATRSTIRAEQNDYLLEPPKAVQAPPREAGEVRGLRYEVVSETLNKPEFFQHKLKGDTLKLILNNDHPFHSILLRDVTERPAAELIELILLAAARAERNLSSPQDRAAIARHREHWSSTLMAFLR